MINTELLKEESKELLLKHLLLNDCKGYVTSDGRLYKAIIDALNEAINFTHCCKSDSEQFSFSDMRSAYEFSSSDECRYDGMTFNEWISKR